MITDPLGGDRASMIIAPAGEPRPSTPPRAKITMMINASTTRRYGALQGLLPKKGLHIRITWCLNGAVYGVGVNRISSEVHLFSQAMFKEILISPMMAKAQLLGMTLIDLPPDHTVAGLIASIHVRPNEPQGPSGVLSPRPPSKKAQEILREEIVDQVVEIATQWQEKMRGAMARHNASPTYIYNLD